MQIRRKAVPRSWTRVAKNHVCQVQFLSLTGHSLQYQLTSANLPPALQTHSQSSIEVPAGCEISAQMRPIATDVARSVVCMSLCVCVCVCVLGVRVSCAKMTEPIEIPFGGRLK